MSENRLQDKVTVITGGASGLGFATAKLFVAQGAKVVVADLDTPTGRAAVEELGVEFVPTDVSQPDAVEALINGVVTEHGRLDVMFNNAGIVLQKPVLETTPEEYQRTVDVNLGGVFNGLRAAGQVMVEQGAGSIINTASNGGSSPTANLAVYSATKAAIIALTKAAAIELAPKGVRVNSLSPGTMLSGMVPDDPAIKAALDKLQPIGYAAEPRLMGHGVVFLASYEAQYVTGHDLVIDGGAIAGRGAVS